MRYIATIAIIVPGVVLWGYAAFYAAFWVWVTATPNADPDRARLAGWFYGALCLVIPYAMYRFLARVWRGHDQENKSP